MRIYFSGSSGLKDTPEVLVPERDPHIMLTFHDLYDRSSGAIKRLKAHLQQPKKTQHESKSRRPAK